MKSIVSLNFLLPAFRPVQSLRLNGRPQSKMSRRSSAFTIVEVMIALFIFSLIIMAIYSTWLAIIRGTKAGLTVAAAVQRSRMAVRTLEDALTTVQMYNANVKQYYFVADTSGDMATLSIVSRLPETFPGVGRYGDQIMRRVSFYTQAGKDGGIDLMLTQVPVLLDTNSQHEAYTITLAKDVSLFKMEFYDALKNEWKDEWKYTNNLPKLVQVALGTGRAKGGSDPQDVVMRIISVPSVAVDGNLQGVGAPIPQAPGAPGTVPGAPGTIPGQTPGAYQQPGNYQQPGAFQQPGFIQPLR